jgi:anti-anti-sigma factor
VKINIRENNHITVIDISGEINFYNATEIKDFFNQFIENNKYYIIINFKDVPYMDSSGFGAMITGMYKLKKYHGDLKIINTFGSVDKVFKITGMESHIEMYDSEIKAIESFKI